MSGPGAEGGPGPAGVVRVADPEDPRLVDYRALTETGRRVRYEAARRVFVVEGRLAVEALARSALAPACRSILVDERRLARLRPTVEALVARGATALVAPAAVVRATVGFDLHRGVVAAVDRPEPADPAAVLAGAATVLAVEGVNDHENLGGLFRNAAAFGVDAVLLDPTCADPWYRRCVRVSMGHVLGVPHARAAPWPGTLADLVAGGWRVVALTPGAGTGPLPAVPPAAAGDRVAVLVGAEGPGLAGATLAVAGIERVRIPMAPGVDSLNVATAAAVALSHLVGSRLA